MTHRIAPLDFSEGSDALWKTQSGICAKIWRGSQWRRTRSPAGDSCNVLAGKLNEPPCFSSGSLKASYLFIFLFFPFRRRSLSFSGKPFDCWLLALPFPSAGPLHPPPSFFFLWKRRGNYSDERSCVHQSVPHIQPHLGFNLQSRNPVQKRQVL